MKNGLQTQKHVLHDWTSRMDEIRFLARMGRKISYGATPHSAVADAKRAPTTIHAVAPDERSNNRSSDHNAAGTANWNSDSTSAVPDAFCPAVHRGTGEADARATGPNVGVTVRSHKEKT